MFIIAQLSTFSSFPGEFSVCLNLDKALRIEVRMHHAIGNLFGGLGVGRVLIDILNI